MKNYYSENEVCRQKQFDAKLKLLFSTKSFQNFHIDRERLFKNIFEESKNNKKEKYNNFNKESDDNKENRDVKMKHFLIGGGVTENCNTLSVNNKIKDQNYERRFRACTYNSCEDNYASLNKQKSISKLNNETDTWEEYLQAGGVMCAENSQRLMSDTMQVEKLNDNLFDYKFVKNANKNDVNCPSSSSKQNKNILDTISEILERKQHIYAPPDYRMTVKRVQQFELHSQSDQKNEQNQQDVFSSILSSKQYNVNKLKNVQFEAEAECIEYKDFKICLNDCSAKDHCSFEDNSLKNIAVQTKHSTPLKQRDETYSRDHLYAAAVSGRFSQKTEPIYNYSTFESPKKKKKRKLKIATKSEVVDGNFSQLNHLIDYNTKFNVSKTKQERKSKIAANFFNKPFSPQNKILGKDYIEDKTMNNDFVSTSSNVTNTESIYVAQRRLMAAIKGCSINNNFTDVDESKSVDPTYIAQRKFMYAIEKGIE